MNSALAQVRESATESPGTTSCGEVAVSADPPTSCDALIRRFRPKILGVARTMCGNEADAEDIAQIVCTKIWKALDGFRGDAQISTWIYRITRNAAVQSYRRRQSIRRAEEEFLCREVPPGGRMPCGLEHLVVRQLLDAVPALLEDLSEPQRQVVRMVDIRGYRPAEVAHSFALNPNTVRSHLLRARRSIRSALHDAQPALVHDFKMRNA